MMMEVSDYPAIDWRAKTTSGKALDEWAYEV